MRKDSPTSSIHIIVNGAHMRIPALVSIGNLIKERGLTGKRIAVELNGEIVPRSRHGDVTVAAGDRIEIVVAVGGG